MKATRTHEASARKDLRLLRQRQQRILKRLQEFLGGPDVPEDSSRLRRFHGRSISTDRPVRDALTEEEEEDLEYELFRFHREIGRAIRAGLVAHPVVARWLFNRRLLGQRSLLRMLKAGVERGVRAPRKPLPPERRKALELLGVAVGELRRRGLSLRSIHANLVKAGAFTGSWQAFHKSVRTHGLDAPAAKKMAT